MSTEVESFESRKRDHVNLALDPRNQALGFSDLESVRLAHDSLPDLNLNEISIQSSLNLATPFFVSGMTAGHAQAESINSTLASIAAARGWIFGVGSQRRQLNQENYIDSSLANLHTRHPNLKIVSNLGIAQVIEMHRAGKINAVIALAEKIGAAMIAIHLNPLQEAIQPEGTPNFQGAMEALSALVSQSPIPVIIKETGCGMSEKTLQKFKSLNLFAVDVSGLGGTHWGRIEGRRAAENTVPEQLGETFKNWGISTVESLIHAKSILKPTTEIWASGGVRTGLDAAKCIALGATRVGFAMPALEAALRGDTALDLWMQKMEWELKVAMFCTNSKNLEQLALARVIL